MFGLGRRRTARKRYDPSAWTRVPVDALQANYDTQGWTGAMGQWRTRSLERLAARIREVSEREGRAATLLDVACFTGEYFGRLMAVDGMERMLRYTGVDVTPQYVQRAAERWAAYANAEFRVGSALQLEFPDRSFDLVFNSGMLIHVADPGRCVRECVRVARALALIETTVEPSLSREWEDENKSGDAFIDRVYRPDYIQALLGAVARVERRSDVPYQRHTSSLYECIPSPE